MNHDPQRLAAAYLTTMRQGARSRFEAHLLACESCWQEVSLASRGRQLAETARDMAPAQLREDIRAAVAAVAAATTRLATSRPLPRHKVAAAVTTLALLASVAALARPWTRNPPPEPAAQPAFVAAAVASYRAGRLPGTAVSDEPAPSLTALHLRLAGAAAGRLRGQPVIMFTYRAPTGARLTIFRSSQPFPEANHARELPGTRDAWTVRSNGVTIICAQHTHAILLLSASTTLVRQASALLKAI